MDIQPADIYLKGDISHYWIYYDYSLLTNCLTSIIRTTRLVRSYIMQEDIAKIRPYNTMMITLMSLHVPKEWAVAQVKIVDINLFEFLENVQQIYQHYNRLVKDKDTATQVIDVDLVLHNGMMMNCLKMLVSIEDHISIENLKY